MSDAITCPPGAALRIDTRSGETAVPQIVVVTIDGRDVVARFAGRYYTGDPRAAQTTYLVMQDGVQLACINPDGTPTSVAADASAAVVGAPTPTTADTLPFTGAPSAALAAIGLTAIVAGWGLTRLGDVISARRADRWGD